MVLKKIKYTIKGKKYSTNARVLTTIPQKFLGLMFRRQSPPLLFVFNKNKKISIHSLFCKPFKAIWLDDKMRSTKIINIRKWRFNFLGNGKYLLEIPLSKKGKVVENRNI
jgi:uncharacterized membrane protein (UPF0127 family)